jgi:hypothetical protein
MRHATTRTPRQAPRTCACHRAVVRRRALAGQTIILQSRFPRALRLDSYAAPRPSEVHFKILLVSVPNGSHRFREPFPECFDSRIVAWCHVRFNAVSRSRCLLSPKPTAAAAVVVSTSIAAAGNYSSYRRREVVVLLCAPPAPTRRATPVWISVYANLRRVNDRPATG